MRSPIQRLALYGLVTVACVGAAFLIAMRFLGRLHAQQGGAVPSTATPKANASPTASPPIPPPPPPPPMGTAQPSAAVHDASPAVTSAATPPAAGGSAPAGPPSTKAAIENEAHTEISELEGFLEPFIYDVVNRRDPFVAFVEYTPPDASSGTSRPLSPAQKFDLDQLKLVGIMWDIKEPKAMFMDPESEVIVLGRDEGIGNRNGYIAAIREGEVVVVEAIRKRGDIVYQTRVLRIER